MKVPLSWLNEYVDVSDINPKKYADELTMSGSKVETLENLGEEIINVVTGKIISLEKHPDANKLQISKVDVGGKVLQIVTGAPNVSVGDIIPIALDGAKLPEGKEIKSGALRGVNSQGMMCSIQELGYTKYDFPEAPDDGVFIMRPDVKLGMDIREALGLNETVVEFEITPNRPDCLSMVGMAKETAVTFDRKLKVDVDKLNATDVKETNSAVNIEIKAPDLCQRYVGRVIKNVKIGQSPEWMRSRLRAAGIRPISNLVDVTNYVMLEYGQPMHAFDFDKIEGKKIVVRRAEKGEVMTTLDGQDRKLNPNMLVIADEKKAVAVAGVMGGANSEVTDTTTTILLESANFNGTSVRLTAKALGFRTEASGRFEKGLDIENTLKAMDRAVELIQEIGAGEAETGYADCYPVKWQQRTIKFRPERINSLLGTKIEKEYMIDLFKKLGLTIDEDKMLAAVPSFRGDIEGEADLSEEVARFYGYNNIESTLYSGDTTVGRKTLKQKVEDMCRDILNAQGISEILTYSMVSPKSFDMINLDQKNALRNSVDILNPLTEEHKIMRTTTVPSMMEVLARNYSRRNPEAKLFEISYVYLPKSLPLAELPEEKEVLTIGMYGKEDFYSIKGAIEELLSSLGITNYDFDRANDPSFHPGRSARLTVNGKIIGTLGEIHPDVLENYGINTRAYVGIIELEDLVNNVNMVNKYKELPRYPAIDRDIAMVVKDEVTVKEIENIIKTVSGKLLENLKLFDVYKGDQISKGLKSVAYSMTFRAADKTLTDDEVNSVFNNIMHELKNKLDATLRD